MKTQAFHTGAVALAFAEGPAAGPPLVLLHGFARRWQDFGPILTAITPHWHAFALDLRGHGASGRTPGAYRVVDYVGDVAAFLDRQVARPAVLLGHSLGGMVAAAVAAERPGLVGAVILEDPPFAMMGRRIAETSYFGLFRAYGELLGATASEDELAAGLAEVRLDAPGSRTVRLGDVRDAAALRFLASCLRQLDPEALEPILAGRWLDGFDVEATLRRVACPALFLQADFAAGGALPDDYAAGLAALLPRGRLYRFDDVGHQIHATVPEAMMTVAWDFLESAGLNFDGSDCTCAPPGGRR